MTTDTTEFIHTADVVLMTLDGRVLLIERASDPFEGLWAFPGGHVDPGETRRQAARRELGEETGVWLDPERLTLLGVYNAPGRDPRGRYDTTAFIAVVQEPITPTAADDARNARWWPLSELPKLAFDHADILNDARRKLTTLA
jgi:8-oxo-dGTP diphosphatase